MNWKDIHPSNKHTQIVHHQHTLKRRETHQWLIMNLEYLHDRISIDRSLQWLIGHMRRMTIMMTSDGLRQRRGRDERMCRRELGGYLNVLYASSVASFRLKGADVVNSDISSLGLISPNKLVLSEAKRRQPFQENLLNLPLNSIGFPSDARLYIFTPRIEKCNVTAHFLAFRLSQTSIM